MADSLRSKRGFKQPNRNADFIRRRAKSVFKVIEDEVVGGVHEYGDGKSTRSLKQPRQPDFSRRELNYVVDLVDKYRDIVESKEIDGPTIRIKRQAWRKIAQEFNAMPDVYKRDDSSIKVCWKNLKQKAKRISTTEIMSNDEYPDEASSSGESLSMKAIADKVLRLFPNIITGDSSVYTEADSPPTKVYKIRTKADKEEPATSVIEVIKSKDGDFQFRELLQSYNQPSPCNDSNENLATNPPECPPASPSNASDDASHHSANLLLQDSSEDMTTKDMICKLALEYHKTRMRYLKIEHEANMKLIEETREMRYEEHRAIIQHLKDQSAGGGGGGATATSEETPPRIPTIVKL